jgi:hypothetical protein
MALCELGGLGSVSSVKSVCSSWGVKDPGEGARAAHASARCAQQKSFPPGTRKSGRRGAVGLRVATT